MIAVDLLGHGGSEKPSSGYSMPEQADLIAEALGRLGVRGATVVGHSLGGTVATALTAQSPDLVSRLVLIDQAPDNSYGQLSLLARLTYWPVLGEALWRLTPDFAIKDALGQAFAPGYDVPDRFVDDVRRMTFNAYDTVGADEDDYTKQEPLDARIRAAGIPLLVIFGGEDQIYDARRALSAYAAIRGARTALIEGAGHSPNVEKPEQVAKLIDAFAAPEPEPGRRGSGTSFRSAVAKCETRDHRPGPPGLAPRRRRSPVRSASFGGGRDFSRARRIGPGTLRDQDPGDRRGSPDGWCCACRRASRERWGCCGAGPRSLAGSARVDDGFDRIVFVPCAEKPRTVWPGGLLLASRKRVSLRVSVGRATIARSASAELSRLATTPRSSDATVRGWRRPLRSTVAARYCQRPPALAQAAMWPAEQKPSAIRCSPRWRTRRTAVSSSAAPQCEHESLPGTSSESLTRHLLRFASGDAGVFGRRR